MRKLAAAIGLALATTAASARASDCAFFGMNPGAPVWNGAVLFDGAYAAEIRASGAGSVRIDFRLDGAASWDDAKLAEYDGIVNAAIAAGLEPLGLVAYEAVEGSQSDWNQNPNGDGMNPYVDAFATATTSLVPHFAGRIRKWEIWNEPSCWSNPSYATDPGNAGCTYLLPVVFAKMMTEVYVRNHDAFTSGASIVSGGLFAHDIGGSFTTASDYLGEVYAQGPWDWLQANEGRRYPWDYLGYHAYIEQGQATDGTKLGQYLDAVRSLQTQNGDAAPFYVTEFGWTTASVSADVQAANLKTAYGVFGARSDVAAAFWFSFRDAPAASLYFGITDENGNAKPALAAMKDVTSGCVGASGGAGASAGGGGATVGGSAGAPSGDGGAGGSVASGGAGASAGGQGGTTAGGASSGGVAGHGGASGGAPSKAGSAGAPSSGGVPASAGTGGEQGASGGASGLAGAAGASAFVLPASGSDESGGCGCGIVGKRTGAVPFSVLAVAVAALARRRRKPGQ